MGTRIGGDADELVCMETPHPFFAIGQFYADFSRTTDDEVVACLQRDTTPVPVADVGAAGAGDPPARGEEVEVSAGALQHLPLRLTIRPVAVAHCLYLAPVALEISERITSRGLQPLSTSPDLATAGAQVAASRQHRATEMAGDWRGVR
jgi:hypothetical protein